MMAIVSFLAQRPADTGQPITLHDAVRHGLVRIELRGVGEGVTSRVELRLTKLTNAPLRITIPRGSAFVPYGRQPLDETELDTQQLPDRQATRSGRLGHGGYR
jgi:hypothetical protein